MKWLFEGHGQIILALFFWFTGCYLVFLGTLYILRYINFIIK